MSDFIFDNNGKAVVVDLKGHIDDEAHVRPAAMEITGDGWYEDKEDPYYTYLFITRFQYKRQTGVSVQTALNGDIHFTSFSPAPTTLQISGIMVQPTSGDNEDNSDKGFEYLHNIANNNLMESSKPKSTDLVHIGVEENMTLVCLLVGLTTDYDYGKSGTNVYNFTMSLFVLGSTRG